MDNDAPHRTLTIDEANEYLDNVLDAIPQDILQELNGGIILSPDTVRSPDGPGLYQMGVYVVDPLGLGRYIVIYYGSFRRVYGRAPLPQQQKALRDVLHHELTHHIESLAGVRDLDELDKIFLEDYHRQHDKTQAPAPGDDRHKHRRKPE